MLLKLNLLFITTKSKQNTKEISHIFHQYNKQFRITTLSKQFFFQALTALIISLHPHLIKLYPNPTINR